MNTAKVMQSVPKSNFFLTLKFLEPGTAEWVMDRSPNVYFLWKTPDNGKPWGADVEGTRVFIKTCNPIHNMPDHYRIDVDERGLPRPFVQDEVLTIIEPFA